MNILLVEDRGESFQYLKELLEAEGHVVLDAFHPNDAQDHWSKRDDGDDCRVDCIILDLNMPTDGLTDDEKAKSCGGLLSGWFWFAGHVLNEAPEMRDRVIIFSDYIKDLKDSVGEAEYAGIFMMPRRGRTSATEDVLDRVKDIAAKYQFARNPRNV